MLIPLQLPLFFLTAGSLWTISILCWWMDDGIFATLWRRDSNILFDLLRRQRRRRFFLLELNFSSQKRRRQTTTNSFIWQTSTLQSQNQFDLFYTATSKSVKMQSQQLLRNASLALLKRSRSRFTMGQQNYFNNVTTTKCTGKKHQQLYNKKLRNKKNQIIML